MSTTPRVSIGLPVYNGEKYLAAAIASCLEQTYRDLELVISDNASTDGTQRICEEFAAKDPRVKYHRVTENQGAAWNFDQVVHVSVGEFFKWHAADDVIGPTFVARCVEMLDTDPTVVNVMPQAVVIDGRGDRIESIAVTKSGDDNPRLTDAEDVARWDYLTSAWANKRYKGVLLYSVRCYEEFGLMRRAVMQRTGLHRSYRGSEKVFLTEMAIAGRFAEIPEVLFFNRWHDDRFSAIDNPQAQLAWVNPKAKHKFVLPRQVRCSLGYAWAIVRMRMGLLERLACAGTFAQFVLRLNKWKKMWTEAWGGRGMTAMLPSSGTTSSRPTSTAS